MRVHLYDTSSERSQIGGQEIVQDWTGEPQLRLWVDLEPQDTIGNSELLRSRLGLHQLALEDAFRERHPPKTEQFQEIQFIIMRELISRALDEDLVRIGLSLFVSEQILVTRSTASSPLVESYWQRAVSEPTMIASPSYLSIDLMNRLVRGYSETLLGLENRLHEIEAEIFDSPHDHQLVELTGYRSKLSQLRLISALHEQVLEELVECSHYAKTRMHDLQNVIDHVKRSVNLSSLYYDIASDLIDSYLAFASHRMNQVMKILTIFTVIFVPLSFLAGVYGMNFEHMPELKSSEGYYVLLGIMGTIVAGQLILFWRKGWF